MLFNFNANILVRFSAKSRIVFNAFIMGLGYTAIAFGCLINFYVVMGGALIVGIGSAFGEVSHFGFLKKLPSNYVGPFWSGTGIWGLTGSLLYLILHSLKVKDYIIFFWLIPIAVWYLTNFLLLSVLSEKNNYFKSNVQENDPIYNNK